MKKPINAIVVFKPLPGSTSAPGTSLGYLWIAIKHRLEREGLLAIPPLPARGPSDFIDYDRRILVFPVQHIRAILVIKNAVDYCGLLEHCEISHEDTEEGTIRGFHPFAQIAFDRHFKTPPPLADDERQFKLAFGYPAAVMVGAALSALYWPLGLALAVGLFVWVLFKTAAVIRRKTFRLP